VGKERGKASEDYFESVAVCYVDAEDMKRLGIREGTSVRVSTGYGSVILKALKSPRGPHTGVIFIPYGVWANAVASTETDSIGMPSLKGIPAEIEPAADKVVLGLSEFLREQFGKE
jgi:formylmethanofuran dehydrogenase subunit D